MSSEETSCFASVETRAQLVCAPSISSEKEKAPRWMRPTTSSPSSAKKGGKAQSAMYSVTPKLHRSTAWWNDAGEGEKRGGVGGAERKGGRDGAREWCEAELWGEK